MTGGRGRLARPCWLALCLLFLALPSRVRAASPEGGARIAITIAGDPDCAPPLRTVLASQLADIAADVTWSCQPRFDADEPFRRVPRASVGARVWVDLSAVDEVRLTLENERENRFFLRRLPLPGGLNEIGREEIAEVVRSATIAVLTDGTSALTRAEARVTAAQWPAPVARQGSRQPASPPERAAPTVVERAREVAPRPPATVEVGIVWTAQALAPEIPLAQEVALSVALARRGSRLSFWAESGYRLPASYDGEQVGVRLTALTVRAGIALWTSPDHPIRLGIGAGGGGKRIWFVPRSDATAVEPASPDHFDTLVGRAFVALRLRASARLVLGVDLLCDVATADVHFDFRDASGATERALSQWPVQPGLSLAAAWRWGD